jgi:glycosyltransferase involved in cell wall biosynthesis
MKAAFILPSLANRGPIIFTKYLIDELKKHDIIIDIFYFKNIIDIDFGIKSKRLNFLRSFNHSKYDIIHTTGARPDIYAMLHIPKSKWIISMHNFFAEDIKMLYPKTKALFIVALWKIALKNAKNIILSSDAMKIYYENMLGKRKNYIIIPYGIIEKPYTPIAEKDRCIFEALRSKGYIILGSVGMLIPRKGFHQILEFLRSSKNYACIIIGEGDQRKNLENIIKEYGLGERIFLLGFREDSYNYYKYIDIYLHVSYSEGFGLAMIEAMSKKLPIVCTDLPIYNEYFSEKDVSLFKVDDIQQLEDAIIRIVKDKDRYINSSYNLFCTKFSVQAMAENHMTFYRSVI